MTRFSLTIVALLGVLAVTPGTSAAQRVRVAVTGASVRIVPEGPAAAGSYTGFVGGGEARLAFAPVHLSVWYLQGGLTPSGGAPDRDLVEGALLLGADPVPWVSLAVGPHIRSYLTPTGTQRWMFWEGRVQGRVAILESVVTTYLDVGWVFGGSVTGVDGFGGGGGLEGGVSVRFPRAPIWARGGYRVERATLGDVDGGETVERLTVSVGIGLW